MRVHLLKILSIVGATLMILGSHVATAQSVLKVKFITPAVLDPIWTTSYVVRMHGFLVYDTLFGSDAQYRTHPQMVESWTVSDDKTIYTFRLRPGLKWHDGDPVTAEDCVASLKRWGVRDVMGQKLFEATKSLDAVDARTFRLTLSKPFGSVIEALGKVSSNVPFMMKKAQASTDAFTQVTEAIGSGPFKFVRAEFQAGVKAVYVKNTDYIPRPEPASNTAGGKIAGVDRIEIISIPDPQTAANALIAGEVDLVFDPIADLLPRLKAANGVKVEVFDPFGLQSMVRINHLNPPFNNPKARQALLYAFDQEMLLRAVAGDDTSLYKICHTMFVCGGPFANEAGAEPFKKVNLDKAKQLLQESGYKGEEIVLMQTTDEAILNAQSPVAAQVLRRVGFKVRVDAVDWATLLKRRASKEPVDKGGWNLFVNWLGGLDMLSPITNIAVAAQCEKAWFGWPCDEQIEKLRTDFAQETDLEKRKAITAEIQKRAYEVVSYVPLGFLYQPVAYRADRLDGLIKSSAHILWNVRKKQ